MCSFLERGSIRRLSLKVFCVFVVWWINLSCMLMCRLMFPQIHCADHLSWNHGPRRGQTETHRRQNPWILFLKCKELQIKKHQLKPCSLLSLISYKELSVGGSFLKGYNLFRCSVEVHETRSPGCWYFWLSRAWLNTCSNIWFCPEKKPPIHELHLRENRSNLKSDKQNEVD